MPSGNLLLTNEDSYDVLEFTQWGELVRTFEEKTCNPFAFMPPGELVTCAGSTVSVWSVDWQTQLRGWTCPDTYTATEADSQEEEPEADAITIRHPALPAGLAVAAPRRVTGSEEDDSEDGSEDDGGLQTIPHGQFVHVAVASGKVYAIVQGTSAGWGNPPRVLYSFH